MKTTKRFGGAWMVAALCALLLAAAPAGAGEAPGTGTIEVAALSPAQEGGQCLAVPAQCGAATAAEELLLLADNTNQCVSSCEDDYDDCVDDCDDDDTACQTTCSNEQDSCKDNCG